MAQSKNSIIIELEKFYLLYCCQLMVKISGNISQYPLWFILSVKSYLYFTKK
jgi:hypothetical protein